jgi:hypothetical protein
MVCALAAFFPCLDFVFAEKAAIAEHDRTRERRVRTQAAVNCAIRVAQLFIEHCTGD